MDSAPTDTRQEPVLVFGGACKTFHRLDPDAESLTPLCGQQGNSPYLKDRNVLKRHYSPCIHCYGRGESDGR